MSSGRLSCGLPPCATLRGAANPENARITMTANPNLRYKNSLDISRSKLGVVKAELADAVFHPNFSGNEALMSIAINDKAPEFTLQDENGKEVSLKSLRGSYVVLYFYPRADTPGCTVEACEFRDSYKKMEKSGAVLLGISPDTSKAQKKFEEKFSLPFTLLADADRKVADSYGVVVQKNMYGK